MKELKPVSISSSRITLSPSKNSSRRARRSIAECLSQLLKSNFRTGITIPWHKRYKYEAVSIDKTSKEVTVALAEINANELGPSKPKNLIVEAMHKLYGLIMHLSRLNMSRHG